MHLFICLFCLKMDNVVHIKPMSNDCHLSDVTISYTRNNNIYPKIVLLPLH